LQISLKNRSLWNFLMQKYYRKNFFKEFCSMKSYDFFICFDEKIVLIFHISILIKNIVLKIIYWFISIFLHIFTIFININKFYFYHYPFLSYHLISYSLPDPSITVISFFFSYTIFFIILHSPLFMRLCRLLLLSSSLKLLFIIIVLL
jgi:hypothetical protein